MIGILSALFGILFFIYIYWALKNRKAIKKAYKTFEKSR